MTITSTSAHPARVVQPLHVHGVRVRIYSQRFSADQMNGQMGETLLVLMDKDGWQLMRGLYVPGPYY